MKRFTLSRLIIFLSACGTVGLSTEALASGFQLWEQDAASLGTYHAGYAALANDASIAFYNPAGIPRIKNQQLVLGSVIIITSFTYRGNVGITEGGDSYTFNDVTSQGGTFNVVPNLHYVAPITDTIGFGFSVDVPFGLKTDYGRSTPIAYAATLTSISVIDLSPSLGFQVTDQFSLGAGFDVQFAKGEFDNVGILLPYTDSVNSPATTSTNSLSGTGYGYHLGFLYQFSPDTRVGISYHSKVNHRLTGSSKFVGPIADLANDGPVISNNANANITLPAYTALSIYHRPYPKWGFMGSVIYTEWSVFKTLTLNNFAGLTSESVSDIIQVTVPENYHNTWNVSIGTEYYATDQITLRGGLGYDQTPASNAYRNVQLPDNDRYILALGGHYQVSKAIGFDISWAHLWMLNQAHINPPSLDLGAQNVTTSGNATGGADVYGVQVTWNM